MSFSIVPKEFIHDLYDHEDSIEKACCLNGSLHVEEAHHHCEMLTYAAFPFLDAILQIAVKNISVPAPELVTSVFDSMSQDRYNLSRFRAPPAA